MTPEQARGDLRICEPPSLPVMFGDSSVGAKRWDAYFHLSMNWMNHLKTISSRLRLRTGAYQTATQLTDGCSHANTHFLEHTFGSEHLAVQEKSISQFAIIDILHGDNTPQGQSGDRSCGLPKDHENRFHSN